MEVAFVAQTEACTFLLDADGICRWTVPAPKANDAVRANAERCLGAQYVATLDPETEGLLAHDPTPGKRLLFARVGADGRIALVRSGPLVEFQRLEADAAPPSLRERVPCVDDGADAAGAIEVDTDDDEDDEEEIDTGVIETVVDAAIETVPFSRSRPSLRAKDSEPETARTPTTVRGFPPPAPSISSRDVRGRGARS